MRRGLIARSPVELPDAVLDARLDRVRAAMRQAQARRARRLYQQYAAGRRVLARRLRAVLVGSAAGRAARGRAVSGRGADLPRQNLDRARQPRRRGSAQPAGRAQSRAADCFRAEKRRGRHRRFRRPAGRHRRRYARGRSGLDVERRQRAVCGACAPRPTRRRSRSQSKPPAIAHRALGAGAGRHAQRHDRRGRARKRGFSAPRKSTSRPRPIWRAMRGFMRIEGERASGKNFALRATVAYKGAWVRLVRTFLRSRACARSRARDLRKRSRNCRPIAALRPASAPGWSKAAAWRSRWSR